MQTDSSACGIYECGSCGYREASECPGCREGNVRFAREGIQVCSVYACVESSGLESCADCAQDSCVLRRSVESICPLRSRFENKRWWAGRMSRVLEGRGRARGGGEGDEVSAKVVTRLRWYLTALDTFAARGDSSVSSWQLAEKVGVSASLIRKDLSRFGDFGTPSFGYRIDVLTGQIRRILRLDRPRSIIWVGACGYRQMRSTVDRLARHGCGVVAVFDSDRSEVGSTAGELTVLGIDELESFVAERDIDAAVLAISGSAAQEVASRLEAAGLSAILNMTGELLVLPDRVRVTSLDVAGEVLELCYYADRR